jgi:hypothetical protein
MRRGYRSEKRGSKSGGRIRKKFFVFPREDEKKLAWRT